jgi:UDP-N-acetylmuramyl pentapeptide phosphotransferase/UDP-N-acetylglucosamine-1-phosphate transferase
MKNFLGIIFFFGVIIYALMEQSKEEPNPYILIIGLAIFLIGFYRIYKKVPSKEEENEQ